jgi:hypothetical protein
MTVYVLWTTHVNLEPNAANYTGLTKIHYRLEVNVMAQEQHSSAY